MTEDEDCNMSLTESIQMNLAAILSISEPNEALFTFMYENHTFVEIKGKTIDEIVKNADEIARSEKGNYGVLYPVILSHNGIELRRTTVAAHVGDNTASMGKWVMAREKWRDEVENDPDIIRILLKNTMS